MEVKFRYKHLRSYTAGKVPTASQLLEGQFAINIPDKKIYTKDNLGNIIDLTDYIPSDIMDTQYVKQGVIPITNKGNSLLVVFISTDHYNCGLLIVSVVSYVSYLF